MNRSAKLQKRHLHRSTRQGGFTIVELMVVVGIILLLAALGITTMNLMANRAVTERTRGTMQMAMGLTTEYKATFNATINHVGIAPFDWNASRAKTATTGSGQPDQWIERWVWVMWTTPKLQNHLKSEAGKDVLVDTDNDGFYELIDGWGSMLAYVECTSRAANDPCNSTNADNFLPSHPSFFFASRGKDTKWGVHDNNNKPDTDALDNLYSHVIE